jgi:hypothetical protein
MAGESGITTASVVISRMSLYSQSATGLTNFTPWKIVRAEAGREGDIMGKPYQAVDVSNLYYHLEAGIL